MHVEQLESHETKSITSTHDDRTERIHPVEGSEGVHKAWAECTDPRSEAEVAAAHHKDRHKGDVEQDSLQSEGEGGCDDRSHPDHSNPDASEWENVHGNEHGGCSHEEGPGISCRIHPQGGSSDGETETGRDRGEYDHQRTGSVAE